MSDLQAFKCSPNVYYGGNSYKERHYHFVLLDKNCHSEINAYGF